MTNAILDRRTALCAVAAGVLAAAAAAPDGGRGARGDVTLADGRIVYSAAGAAITDVREIAVGESLAVLWTERDDAGAARDRHVLSPDGRRFGRPRDAAYVIQLRYANFDPLRAIPHAPADLAAGQLERDVYIVQFVTRPMQAYLDALVAEGATVRTFVADQARLVELAPQTRARVEQLPFVRWVGPYHPAYKLEERILSADPATEGVVEYSIQVIEKGPRQQQIVAQRVLELGGQVTLTVPRSMRLQALLTRVQAIEIARAPEVLFIDIPGEDGEDVDLAREIGGANYIEGIGGYSGATVRGEVMDGGLLTTHADFQSNPPQIHGVNTSSTDHGTPVYGIVFGDGASDPSARGFLPDADGIFSSSASLGDRYAHTQELVDPFGPYRACFQTNSWGGARTIYYTTVSSEMDDILFDLDFLITQSQSNAGNADSRPQAWAKNIVSIGGICHFNSLARGDDRWNGCGGGSTGPATDGRIKPDLWHFYDATLAPSDASPTSYTQFGGTSGATPIVAGHFGLFFELWADGIFGNPVGGGDAFDERPHATTAKAMMINTAHRYRYVRPSISRHNQGWGMPDLASMYDLRDKMLIVDESDLLAELGTNAYVVQVEPNEPAFSATLVYADPPGATSSSQHRINDLSLRVTSPTGQRYWGNFGLDDSDSSLAGGWSNTVDTVENVLLDNPVAGRWLIEVLADELNEDGHVETPALDADYALVVSGVTPVTPDLRLRVALAPGPLVAPAEGPLVVVEAAAGGQLLAGAPTLHYRHDAGAFLAIAMSPAAGDSFTASIPAADCGDTPEFYIEAQGVGGATVRLPDGAPANAFQYSVGEDAEIFADDFESNLGWTVGDAGDSATTGVWNRGDPDGTPAQPENDHTPAGVMCWATNGSAGGSIGTNDIDGGQTTLLSPLFDLSAHPEAVVSYWRWYCNTGGGSPFEDVWKVDVTANGVDWVNLETAGPDAQDVVGGWFFRSYRVADFVPPGATVRLRFVASDLGAGSIVEAAVDDFRIFEASCEPPAPCTGDLDGDQTIGLADLSLILSNFGIPSGATPEQGDLDGDGDVDLTDLSSMLALFGSSCG